MTSPEDDDLRSRILASLRQTAGEMDGPVDAKAVVARFKEDLAGKMKTALDRIKEPRELEEESLASAVLDALRPVLGERQFAPLPSEEADVLVFERRFEGGRQSLTFFIKSRTGRSLFTPIFGVSVSLGLRLDAVEVARSSALGVEEGAYERSTVTTQLAFLGIAGGGAKGEMDWELETQAELPGVLEAMLGAMREKVLPFFDAHRDLASLNRGCNGAGDELAYEPVGQDPYDGSDTRRFDASSVPRRQMTALVVAHLAGDPRVSTLLRAYTSQVSNCRAADRAEFERLVAGLFAGR